MAIFQKILRKFNKNQKSKPAFLNDTFTSYNRVVENNAVAFSCIDRIASSIAGLSYGVYRSSNDAKVKNHPLIDVIYSPNLEETHSQFIYQIVSDLYTAGNAYIYTYKDGEGNITNLFRLDPKAVFVNRDEFNRKVYLYYGKTYKADQVLQIASRWGYDGLKGKSIFEVCRETFDTANSLDAFTNSSFTNSLGKRLVIDLSEAYPNATEEEMRRIRERYAQNYSGASNAGKAVVKTNKVKFETLDTGTSNNQSSELTENKNFQLKVLSLIFGVPLEILSGEGSSDLEKLTTLYTTNAVAPIVQQLEESFQKLFRIEDRAKYYFKFSFNSLLRTSLASKIDAYVKQMNNGLLTINEIRAKENLPPIEDGDLAYRPSNLLPVLSELDNALGASAKLKQAEYESIEKPTATQKNAEASGLGSELLQ